MAKNQSCTFGCSVEAALSVIGGKWKGVILFHLLEGTKRFNELHRELPGITQRMLTLQLRELEADQVVHRKVYAEVPPRVEYRLTEFGMTLKPILMDLRLWGDSYKNQLGLVRQQQQDNAEVEA